ncbi:MULTISPECIES: argininosuccinate lyase [Thermoactinomyces]|jgi:argininosuccinate lyase|uniref:Argininosuccinate lyase n=1 Tax=Thermoactinomyces daqus TaxID=1329516 RepID=A0A7W1X7L3_9BACL|nr:MULTISPECIES: argininosuccinate lyase [Thermoactinomyces]MBA4541449.1 argininosuccinate lyase [Thermoactinomyces daqus]MBH8596921.1 argininosuccinate lyase [Thermoactinomyces sp. CICC 10523]MBH8607668.1 argininosuccinate lyase [Thermoactinomyces sp. CICC 10521]
MRLCDRIAREDGSVFPGKTYAESILRPVFELQRDHLYHAMMEVQRAHVRMLFDAEILSRQEAAQMLRAIGKIREKGSQALAYDPRHEDLFFLLEAKIAGEIGDDLAGNMHIGRSRNDLGVTVFRMVLRDRLLALIRQLLRLKKTLLELSGEHVSTLMPAHTHTQPAQPITLAHYLLAVFDGLRRETERCWSAYKTVNRSPMGAAALSATGFPIIRQTVCDWLGFSEVIENTYDAIGGADYLVETATSALSLMTFLGRFLHNLLFWCTKEAGVIRVADPYVQVSSIMPQKRNPVSLEHARALSSSAIGEAQAVVMMVHNTPFGDIVDTEENLQPHLYQALEKSERVVRLLTAVLATMQVDRGKLRAEAGKYCCTITELADHLFRTEGIPFRKAHSIAAFVAAKASSSQLGLAQVPVGWVNDAALKVTGKALHLDEKMWGKIADPEYFVNRRDRTGGPAPQVVTEMIRKRERIWESEKAKLMQERQRLAKAEADLDAKVKECCQGES